VRGETLRGGRRPIRVVVRALESSDRIWFAMFRVHPPPANRFTRQLISNEDLLQLGEGLRRLVRLSGQGVTGQVLAVVYVDDRWKRRLVDGLFAAIIRHPSPDLILPGQVQGFRRQQ
jgi:hypothetical protein